MKKFVYIGLILGALIVMAFPVKSTCESGKVCGGSTPTYDKDSPCKQVITRPLIANIFGINWYYGFGPEC
jgi:hypothetical protein